MPILIDCLKEIPDTRRNQSKQFELWEILFCAIACFSANGESYRDIARFTKAKFTELKQFLGLNWKQVPHYTTFRNILLSIERVDLENAFRKFSEQLLQKNSLESLAVDGKTLKGSYDNELEKKPVHLLQIFEPIKKIIVAHEEVGEKTNEIPVWQALAEKIQLKEIVVTLDALHCQKNSWNNS